MSEEKSEIEQVYVNLIDTQKRTIDSLEGTIDVLEQQVNVQKEHIELLEQKAGLLEQAVMQRDSLLKIYEKAMAGTESSVIAKEMMDKSTEEHKETS